MKGRKFRFGALLFVFLLALVALGGCGGSSHNTPEPNSGPSPNPQPVGVLEAWTGTWKSFYGSVSDPSMISVYSEVQKYYKEQYSVKGIESLFETMLCTGFDSLKVEGDVVTYLDDKGVAQGTVAYALKGTQPSGVKEDGKDVLWYLFEASSVSDKTGNYKYLVLQEPIKKADEPLRISMYYGDKGFDAIFAELKNGSLWGPAIRPESVPVAPYAEQLKKNAAEFKGWFPAPFALGKWEGEWVNVVGFLDDPLMKPVYEAVSKEAKEKGKNYMPEDVKAFYKNMLASDLQSGTIKDNKVTVFDSKARVKVSESYVFDGIKLGKFKFGDEVFPMRWRVFKTDADNAYKYLLLMPSESEDDGFTYFYMRYGPEIEDRFLNDPNYKWFPVLCEPTKAAERYAEKELKEAKETVDILPDLP